MTRVVGISGSLRKGSFNTALLRAAQELMPAGATLEIATIAGIPLYDGDLEAEQGIPPAVAALKDAIAAADGVLLVTPEYNNGIPGVFKNAIDWASRPPQDVDRVFKGRPFAVIGASPGGFGTILAPGPLAAGVAHARHAAVVRWPPDGGPRRQRVRGRPLGRCRPPQAAGGLHDRFRCLDPDRRMTAPAWRLSVPACATRERPLSCQSSRRAGRQTRRHAPLPVRGCLRAGVWWCCPCRR